MCFPEIFLQMYFYYFSGKHISGKQRYFRNCLLISGRVYLICIFRKCIFIIFPENTFPESKCIFRNCLFNFRKGIFNLYFPEMFLYFFERIPENTFPKRKYFPELYLSLIIYFLQMYFPVNLPISVQIL